MYFLILTTRLVNYILNLAINILRVLRTRKTLNERYKYHVIPQKSSFQYNFVSINN